MRIKRKHNKEIFKMMSELRPNCSNTKIEKIMKNQKILKNQVGSKTF
jgi:hypothetical protein